MYMTLSIATAIAAFLIGGIIFFRSKRVENRVGIAVLLIVFIAGSFLYDNATYLFDYCRHKDSYVEWSGTMTRHGRSHGACRAILAYEYGDEAGLASVPIAFYEEVPKTIPIMLRDGQSRFARVTRAQAMITGRTIILVAVGIWILLACLLKPSSNKKDST